MFILLAYDVDFKNGDGPKRLRNVAKVCCNYGIRVQNSVFEMEIDNAQFVKLKGRLKSIIDIDNDSIRFYLLGNKWSNKIEILGKKNTIEQGEALIF